MYNIEKFNQQTLIRIIYDLGLTCQAKVISRQSKYKGHIFDVTWASDWYINLKVMPINRNYLYNFDSVELTQESIDRFKNSLHGTMHGAVDFFENSVKAEDIIFYDGMLYKILFFVEGKSKNVALSPIIKTNEEDRALSGSLRDLFVYISDLQESVLINDPLLLLKI